jgi:hypothetical protein
VCTSRRGLSCVRKAWGPGCQCCAQWKVGCSLVGVKRRVEKKEGKWRLVSEGREKNSAAPMMELSDGFMEQVEAIAKELRNIGRGIWVLVEGIGKLMEVVEGVGKEGVRKEDKETETEVVQRMDKQTETERREEDSEEEEESEEEEGKEDDGKEDRDQEMEEMEKE